ncbi:MAG: inositol monophosphatase family protein [Alkalispirochaetaceae bacterium]
MTIALDTLIDVILAAGSLCLEEFDSFDREKTEFKSETDLVTEVDRRVQRFLVDMLTDRCGTLSFIAEEDEQGHAITDAPTFIIDPVDGTTNFVHHLPHWCISLGYWEKREPVLAAVYAPVTGELFTAERSGGAWLRTGGGKEGVRLSVSDNNRPRHALGCSGLFGGSDSMRQQSALLLGRALAQMRDVRRHGAAALDLCYLAAGRYDLFWEGHLSAWDVAAGSLIVEEAGGRVTDLYGRTSSPEELLSARSVLAGNPEMHRWFLETLA